MGLYNNSLLQLSHGKREHVARKVVSRLEHDFEYEGLHRHSLGTTSQITARFKWQDEYFRLIPSSPVLLGYYRNNLFIG